MEEDIKILEEWIEETNKAWGENEWLEEIPMPREKIALENLLKRNKDLEENISKEHTLGYSQGVYDCSEAWKEEIREKIEELETRLKVFEKDIRYCKDRVEARLMNDEIYVLRRCRDLLQELLEEKEN